MGEEWPMSPPPQARRLVLEIVDEKSAGSVMSPAAQKLRDGMYLLYLT